MILVMSILTGDSSTAGATSYAPEMTTLQAQWSEPAGFTEVLKPGQSINIPPADNQTIFQLYAPQAMGDNTRRVATTTL
jgi:hypothetical protein